MTTFPERNWVKTQTKITWVTRGSSSLSTAKVRISKLFGSHLKLMLGVLMVVMVSGLLGRKCWNRQHILQRAAPWPGFVCSVLQKQKSSILWLVLIFFKKKIPVSHIECNVDNKPMWKHWSTSLCDAKLMSLRAMPEFPWKASWHGGLEIINRAQGLNWMVGQLYWEQCHRRSLAYILNKKAKILETPTEYFIDSYIATY